MAIRSGLGFDRDGAKPGAPMSGRPRIFGSRLEPLGRLVASPTSSGGRAMEEQGIACLSCGAAELIQEDSPRLKETGKWPAWESGPQEFDCPKCGGGPIWAAEPRMVAPGAGEQGGG